MQIGIIGLGKMGSGLALNLHEHGWEVFAFNRTTAKTEALTGQGVIPTYSVEELVSKLAAPRVVWTMLTAGEPTQEMIFGEKGLINYLESGDTIIEGGNSLYKQDAENAARLKEKGIHYIDAGVSGGPDGARNGACIMIGGESQPFHSCEQVFKDLAVENGYKFFPGHGAGHFVKMVHNGIEYGMMQAIAEGFNLMKKSDYNLNLVEVADIYEHASVIESRLIGWMKLGFEKYGQDLSEVKGEVDSLGEGLWTAQAAKEMGEPAPVIQAAVDFREQSQTSPSYTGQILSMLRNMFGSHPIKN